MYSSFFRIFLLVLIVVTILICSYSATIIYTFSDSSEFIWPIPDSHRITSYYGPRKAPTKGSSTNHSGIDIGAPAGTKLYSCFSGQIIFLGFKGAGGFTITIQHDNFTASYCHISPDFIVSVGEFVPSNTHIADVGPKNVYGVLNNPYKDSNGNPTNGATTGSHLHLTLKKDGKTVNPLEYFDF